MYDRDGNLASVSLPSGTTISYTADGDGLRQSRTSAGATTELLWDTSGELPRLLDDGNNTYVYGPGGAPVAQVDDSAGGIQYLHHDQVGSTRFITDASGSGVGTYRYGAYGAPATHQGAATSSIGYTGAWTDTDTGLVYLRARDYDPQTGQFLQVDPALVQTRQPYAYVTNSPLTVTDPSGLCGDHPTPTITCSEPPLWAQALNSGPANWLTDILTKGPTGEVSNFAQGIGNGATGGLTGMLRDALTPAYACVADQSVFYSAGTVAGVAGVVVASAGVEAVAEGASEVAAESYVPESEVAFGPVEEDASRTYEAVKAGMPTGNKGGQSFRNLEGRLPAQDANRVPISYREWDTTSARPRDGRRLVTGSDGSAYFTSNHYQTFVQFR